VWTVSLPVTIVNGIATRNPEIHTADILGWIMWGIGVTIEAVADQQKLQLKRDLASQRRWCDVGVWRWSRHPNYFGEVCRCITAGACRLCSTNQSSVTEFCFLDGLQLSSSRNR
jgi:steroid 5-alpha reductase family enzyme